MARHRTRGGAHTWLSAVVAGIAVAFAHGGALGQAFDLPVGPALGELEPDPVPHVDDPDDEDQPIFFDEDLPADTENIVYVVDRSSSMSLPVDPFVDLNGQVVQNGTRLDYVKVELKRSISSLTSAFTFNVIIYDECMDAWQGTRAQATPENKASAIAWVDAIEPWGWTNTGGATTMALADKEVQTVLLLSDGAPNFLDCAQTYVGDYDTHRMLVRQANQQAAIIHTFGIGLDPATRTFLNQLAQENGGTFREID